MLIWHSYKNSVLHSNLISYTNIKSVYSVPNILKKHMHTHTQIQMSMLYPPICKTPQPTCSIKIHYYMKGVLVTKLLFPLLTRNVNSNCLWQEMDKESVLLTFTIVGFCGGCTLFSCSAHQSIPLKKGCVLTLSNRP